MRLKDINKYSLEITKEDYIPTNGILHIEDDDENIYMVPSKPLNFELLAKGEQLPYGEAMAIQLNEGVKTMRDGKFPFDYRRIIWVFRNGKVIIVEPNLANPGTSLTKEYYQIKFAKGGSRGPLLDDDNYGFEGNHWGANSFYLINEAVIKEDEFLNWINENPFEVK